MSNIAYFDRNEYLTEQKKRQKAESAQHQLVRCLYTSYCNGHSLFVFFGSFRVNETTASPESNYNLNIELMFAGINMFLAIVQ